MCRLLLAAVLVSAVPLAARADGCDDAKSSCDERTSACEYLANTVPRNSSARAALIQQRQQCAQSKAESCSAYEKCQAAERAKAQDTARRAAEQPPDSGPAEEASRPARPPPPADAGPPPPPQPLADRELEAGVQEAKERFAVCVHENLAHAPQGTYVLRFTVQPSGEVTDFSALGPGIENADVLACFGRVGARLRYRPSPAPAQARVSLRY